MNPLHISATIVAYKNNIDELNLSIKSFLATNLNVAIYIIDNSPTDSLKDKIYKDNRVRYIFMNKNNGFGAGHNEILSHPEFMGKYHLVLNPDIHFDPGVIDRLYSYMEENPDVGNVMPKVIYPNGDLQYLCKLLPTPADLLVRRFLPAGWTQRRMERFEMRASGYDHVMDVPYLSGCFMFLRTAVSLTLMESHR